MIVSAPAKINLTLEVTGLEPNGYHTLDTLFVWLELADTLHLEASEELLFEMEGEDVSLDLVRTDESNLVLKALRALEKHQGRSLPTRIKLHKRIPSGGGLGGGSADAAATLYGLNLVHQLNLSQQQLLELARPLGADVAFGLVGGLARGTRYGDLLETIEKDMSLWNKSLVLVMPPFPCPTPAVYKLWDESKEMTAAGSTELFLSSKSESEEFGAIKNDLQEPAFRLQPSLREFHQQMTEHGLQSVCLSGSGSTLFGFCPDDLDLSPLELWLEERQSRLVRTKCKKERRFELVS